MSTVPNSTLIPTTLTFPVQDSESFLQGVMYTYLPHLKNALYRSALGIFHRVLSLPNSFRGIFNPFRYCDAHDHRIVYNILRKCSAELTHEYIDAMEDPIRWNWNGPRSEPSKEHLHYIVNRIHELAKESGIAQKIKIFPTPESCAGIGTRFSDVAIILINRKTALSSKEVIDFTMAHEIAHIAQDDLLKREVLKVSFLALDLLAAVFISPLAIPFCEAIAAPIENFVERQQEAYADRAAIKLLKTNRGAIELFTSRIEEGKRLRALANGNSKINLKKCDISPEGNFRLDITHPPYTQRLANAQAFPMTKKAG